MSFADVLTDGLTTVTRLEGAPALAPGYLSNGALYFDVSSTATYFGDITVCLPYDPGSLIEPRLLHLDGSEWIEVTISIDQANGVVCGLTDGLSPFATAKAIPELDPQTTIEEGPEATVVETEAGLATVTFVFGSSVQFPDFECSFDSGASWSSCDNPFHYDAILGTHSLLVRASNSLNDAVDMTPAGPYTFTVVARPVVTILAGPADEAPEEIGVQNDAQNATFTFQSDQPGSTFECQLIGESGSIVWESCTSPKSYSGLAMDEEYTFEVRATNAAGVASLLPAEFEWEVADFTAPTTTLTSFPADPTSATTATFTYLANEPATFECSLDGAQFGACPLTGITYNGLDVGEHTFRVQATDLSERENLELRRRSSTLDGRHRRAGGDDHGHADRLDVLLLHRQRQPHCSGRPRLPVQARQLRLLGVHEPEDVLERRARRRPAHLPGARDRRVRQCRRARQPQLDGARHDGAKHDADGAAAGFHDRHERVVRLRLQRRPRPPSSASSTRARSPLHHAEDVHRPRARSAHLRSARDRRGRERGPVPGELHVDDPRAAGHDRAEHDARPLSRRRRPRTRTPRSRSSRTRPR